MSATADTHGSTAVLAGLACIADDPEILSVQEIPVSLWLRSDPDESKDGEDSTTLVRICTQGQDKNATANLRDRVSASHPVHFELRAADDEPPSLDLSVFGTPAEVFDEDIIEGWNSENFAYTNVNKVTEFGRFEQQLPQSTVKPGKRICHVYLYVDVSRLSVAFYAIFRKDGRAVKPLEKTSFDEAVQNGELTTKWKKHQNVALDLVRLKQVARPESLSTSLIERSASPSHQLEVNNPREISASRSQQSGDGDSRDFSVLASQQDEATDSNISPPHPSVSERDGKRDGQGRTALIPRKGKLKRLSMTKLAASKRKKTTPTVRSRESRLEDDESESEMEM